MYRSVLGCNGLCYLHGKQIYPVCVDSVHHTELSIIRAAQFTSLRCMAMYITQCCWTIYANISSGVASSANIDPLSFHMDRLSLMRAKCLWEMARSWRKPHVRSLLRLLLAAIRNKNWRIRALRREVSVRLICCILDFSPKMLITMRIAMSFRMSIDPYASSTPSWFQAYSDARRLLLEECFLAWTGGLLGERYDSNVSQVKNW